MLKFVWKGLGGEAVEDGSIHGGEGPSDRGIQSHAAEQPAPAGGAQERRGCPQEIDRKSVV